MEEDPEQDSEPVAVSATKIRKALGEWKVSIDNQYLGYPYSVSGQVVKGDQLGRKLGYPTENLFVEESYKIIPRDGIYAVNALLGARKLQRMLYIGNRHTIHGMVRKSEDNILLFGQAISY